jgi:hypothetical protein
MVPNLYKPRLTNCDNPVGITSLTNGYKPGDAYITVVPFDLGAAADVCHIACQLPLAAELYVGRTRMHDAAACVPRICMLHQAKLV